MRPTEKQIRWLKKLLPKNAVPTDVIPRAYCILKPSLGSAAFALPFFDLRKHLTKKEDAKYHSGLLIDTFESPCIADVCLGDWATLVYAVVEGHSALWYCTPVPMPLKVLDTAKSMKSGTKGGK